MKSELLVSSPEPGISDEALEIYIASDLPRDHRLAQILHKKLLPVLDLPGSNQSHDSIRSLLSTTTVKDEVRPASYSSPVSLASTSFPVSRLD